MFSRRNKHSKDTIPARRQQLPSKEPSRVRQDEADRYAFRRNRTLTGSSSAKVASSIELHAEFRSPRAHVHHLTSFRRRLLGYLGLIVILASGVYLLLSQLVATQYFQVAGVQVLPDNRQSEYRNTMEQYYAARPTERIRVLLDEERLLSHMQATHSEIRSVDIMQSGLGEANITIVARKPIARWSIGNDDRYVDGSGVVFSENFYESPDLTIVDDSGAQVDSGELVASNRFLGFVGRLLNAANERQLTVSKVTLPAFTTRQVEVVFGGKTRYKVSVDRSAGQQVEDIDRILTYLEKRNITADYVDVRLEGKAFYK